MKKRLLKFIFIIILLCVSLLFIFPNFSFASDPKLISKLNSAFTQIEKWFLKLATPAAAVAVGTGIFMKKFSFGDDEKIRTGKKLIRTALISYIFIILLRLILTTISNLLSS